MVFVEGVLFIYSFCSCKSHLRIIDLVEVIVKLKKLLRIPFTLDIENLDRFTYETGKKKMLKLLSKFESVVVLKTYKFVIEKCWKCENHFRNCFNIC